MRPALPLFLCASLLAACGARDPKPDCTIAPTVTGSAGPVVDGCQVLTFTGNAYGKAWQEGETGAWFECPSAAPCSDVSEFVACPNGNECEGIGVCNHGKCRGSGTFVRVGADGTIQAEVCSPAKGTVTVGFVGKACGIAEATPCTLDSECGAPWTCNTVTGHCEYQARGSVDVDL